MIRRTDPLLRALGLLDLSWRRVATAVLAGAGGLGSAVALAAVSAWLIARASQMPPVMTLSIAAVAVRTFGISRGVLRYLERLVSHDIALRGMATLRTQVYRRLADGRTGPLMALRRGDLLARVSADVDAVGDLVVRGLLPAAVAVVVGAGSVVLLGAFLPTAGLALAGCLVLAGMLAPWLAVRAARTVERESARARAEMSAVTLSLLDGAAELTVAGRTGTALAELARADADLARATDVGARPAAAAAAAVPLSTGLAVLAALALGIPATTSGALAPVELAVVVLTPLAAFEAVALLPAAGVQVLRSRQAAARIMELLDATSGPAENPLTGTPLTQTPQVDADQARAVSTRAGTTPDPAGPALLATPPEPVLWASSLACGWPGRPPVLTGIDLVLHPGRTVAVVGPSGVGKTTLLLTLAGLLPPAAGELAVGGAAASTPPVTMTAEDAHVFDTTVLENLRVARGNVTEAEALTVLAGVGLGPWVAGLPDGLRTVLGSDAARLSGGERRRLLVARSLLGPSPLILLDEPTEHLDAGAERLLADLLTPSSALVAGRGVLVVTHRLAGLERADEVIVLDTAGTGGTVRARGPHRAMLSKVPATAGYRAAWESQTQERR